jgi:hypothetical protein
MKSCNYCTHCNMIGHWIEKCWKLHPELGPKKDKQVMQAPVRQVKTEEEKHVINILKVEGHHIKKEIPLVGLGKR